jgi:hypothetical protein
MILYIVKIVSYTSIIMHDTTVRSLLTVVRAPIEDPIKGHRGCGSPPGEANSCVWTTRRKRFSFHSETTLIAGSSPILDLREQIAFFLPRGRLSLQDPFYVYCDAALSASARSFPRWKLRHPRAAWRPSSEFTLHHSHDHATWRYRLTVVIT